jgi:hypothetical protein
MAKADRPAVFSVPNSSAMIVEAGKIKGARLRATKRIQSSLILPISYPEWERQKTTSIKAA